MDFLFNVILIKIKLVLIIQAKALLQIIFSTPDFSFDHKRSEVKSVCQLIVVTSCSAMLQTGDYPADFSTSQVATSSLFSLGVMTEYMEQVEI